MQSITIKGSKRESVGKKATRALRNADKVPCVIYGEGEPVHFSAEEITFKALVYTPNVYFANIELDNGETYNAVMQDIQFHPVSEQILHIDFYQLNKEKPLNINLPVKLEGASVGVRNGGVLRFPNRKLSVTALPDDLPDFLTVDISNLKIGDKFYVREFDEEKLTFNHPEDMVVCQVRTARAAIVDVVDDEDEDEDDVEGSGESEDAPADGGGDAPAEE